MLDYQEFSVFLPEIYIFLSIFLYHDQKEMKRNIERNFAGSG